MTVDELYEAFEKALNERPINFQVNDLDGFIRILGLGWKNTVKATFGCEEVKRDLISCAEHDRIWLDVDLEWLASVATLDDINYISDCHIHVDEDAGLLYMLT